MALSFALACAALLVPGARLELPFSTDVVTPAVIIIPLLQVILGETALTSAAAELESGAARSTTALRVGTFAVALLGTPLLTAAFLLAVDPEAAYVVSRNLLGLVGLSSLVLLILRTETVWLPLAGLTMASVTVGSAGTNIPYAWAWLVHSSTSEIGWWIASALFFLGLAARIVRYLAGWTAPSFTAR